MKVKRTVGVKNAESPVAQGVCNAKCSLYLLYFPLLTPPFSHPPK